MAVMQGRSRTCPGGPGAYCERPQKPHMEVVAVWWVWD
jgi:hypothetical protein